MTDALPPDLRYTRDHEWARVESGEVLVGITGFAVEQLGDITLVNLDVKVGDELSAGKPFGTIESVKTLSDLYAPIAGRVLRVNAELVNKPELVNQDCYGSGWMIAILPGDAKAVEALLDVDAYAAYLKTATP
jgi:glycine cleavage system H protein